MSKVVVLGGGKGQSSLLRALKRYDELELSAIVTVADDGGSTGRLRQEFNMPAMGDIRNVMLSLAESESLLGDIMNYRFDDNSRSTLAGHNLGNLILTALTDTTGNFMDAIASVSKVLSVMGDIIPASEDLIVLCARMADGTIIRGESNIPMYQNHIKEVYYDVPVEATPQAIKAIMEADVIIFGVGSLYTSILPNVIVPKIKEAIKNSKAKKVYYVNAMSQAGETQGYCAEDHVDALIDHGDFNLDLVVGSIDEIPQSVLDVYAEEDLQRVQFEKENHDYPILFQSLLSYENNIAWHDVDKIYSGFKDVMEAIGCPLAQK